MARHWVFAFSVWKIKVGKDQAIFEGRLNQQYCFLSMAWPVSILIGEHVAVIDRYKSARINF